MTIANTISSWIAEQVRAAGAEGAVIGLSGGVDSSVTAVLTKRALGDRVLGLLMPCHSDPQDLAHARLVAEKFHIRAELVDLTPVFDSFMAVLPREERIAQANLKARLRMVTLYYYANLYNYLVVGTSNRSELAVGYFCYDECTRAMTTEGLKSYKELKPGDRVFSLDLNTGHVIECSVAGVYTFDYDGEMLAYGGGRGSKIDLMVTPNHRVLIERHGRPQFCRADAMPSRSTPTPIPKPWRGRKDPPSVFEFDNDGIGANARQFTPMPMEEFLYILGLYIGDEHAQAYPVIQPVKGSGRAHDPETGRFVAADAIATPREYIGYKTWFALPEGSKARSRLISLLEKNGIKYGTTETQVWVSGRPFYRAMEACGTSAHIKHIPSWVMDYPAKYLTRLLEGLMDSNGDKRGYYYTTSQHLAMQLVELGCKIGKNVTLRTRPPRTVTRANGVKIKSAESYEVSIYGNGRHWLAGAKFRRVPYHGLVWCPDVPGAHNLLVERNGRFLFCGNTKYGDGGADILPLGGLLKGQVWELARELGIPQPIIDKPPSGGLWPGQTDEGEMGITYREIDEVLLALDAGETHRVPADTLAKVQRMMNRAAHKRVMPPICPLP